MVYYSDAKIIKPVCYRVQSAEVQQLADDSLNFVVPENVLISLEGTDYSTLSAETGYWEIADVPAGIYTIKYSKAGFMSAKMYNVQFTGSGSYYTYGKTLGQIPPVIVTQLIASSDSVKIHINGSVSAPTERYRYIALLFSKNPIEITSEMIFDYVNYSLARPDSVNFSTSFSVTDMDKISYGLQTGERLYVTAIVGPTYDWDYNNINPVTRKYELDSEGITFSNIDTVYVP